MRKTPDKWNKVKLGDISEMCLGKMLDQEKNKGELQPYLANVNVRWGSFDFKDLNMMRFEQNEHDRYGLKFGDIVICEGGEAGRCAIWKNEIPNMKIQKALHRVRIKDGYDNQFVYYRFLLAGITGELEKYFTGSTIKHLTGYSLKQVAFAFPSLPIQQKIAAILSAYDDLIENNLKQIRLLEEMAQITYQEWFVRLKFPNHENTPIDETTGLPIGWHFGKVIDLIELQRGFDLPIQDREHGSIPIIASTGTVGFHSSYKVQGAGVVTGRSGTIGQVMFVDSDFFPLNTTLWVKSYKSCKPIFVKHLLDSLNIESLCGGAAVPSLDRKAVHVQKAVIPPAKLMNDFDVYAASHYEAMKVLRSQNQLLKEARDILLPRLMTGKITVE